MAKEVLKKVKFGIALQFSLFLFVLIFANLDFDFLFKLSFLSFIVIFIWTIYYLKVFVVHSNKKAFNRIKNKQPIFTDSLTDDEDDDTIKNIDK